jgi:hypothetical protein
VPTHVDILLPAVASPKRTWRTIGMHGRSRVETVRHAKLISHNENGNERTDACNHEEMHERDNVPVWSEFDR